MAVSAEPRSRSWPAKLVIAVMVAGMVGSALVGSVAETSAATSPAWANIEFDDFGNPLLASGRGATGVAHLRSVGQYVVTFDRDVSKCAYLATAALELSGEHWIVSTAGGPTASDVYVQVKDQSGVLQSYSRFHLLVDCGGKGMRYAVVGNTNNLVRASKGTTLHKLSGAGRYEIAFTSNVASCAYLATVGDPGKDSAILYRSNVYTASGAATNRVRVETRDRLGALANGIPFHLAVVCPSAPSARVAVVASSGLVRRGSNLTSAFRLRDGVPVVVNDRDVWACAWIATRGSVDRKAPKQGTVALYREGPSFNLAYLELRDLNIFGAGAANQSFHIAIVC